MEEKEIPADNVILPSPQRITAWLGHLKNAILQKKVKNVVLNDEFVLTVNFDGKHFLSFCTHPSLPALCLKNQEFPFLESPLVLKENISGLTLFDIVAPPGEPILMFVFKGRLERTLVWEGFKRFSNVLMLDDENRVIWALRSFKGEFRKGAPFEVWRPPPPRGPLEKETEGYRPELELTSLIPGLIFKYLLEKAKSRAKKSLVSKAKSLARKREALAGEKEEAGKWLSLESRAKSVLSSCDLHKRGEESLKILDYSVHPAEEVKIAIDPALTVLENAEKMFKLAKKGKERLRILPERIKEIDSEIKRVEAETVEIDNLTELQKLYPTKAWKKKKSLEKTESSRLPKNVAVLELPKDFRGYAGKTAQGNDYVSFKLAKGEDFWFHVADYKGSHLVVKNPKRLDELPLEIELFACKYAAAHSKAPKESAVDVIVTKAKFLARVKKTPGAVFVSHFRKRLVDLRENG